MKQTLQIKLLPTPKQWKALHETMIQFNAACNEVAELAYQLKSANKIKIQSIIYKKLREKYHLPAQMAVRAIAKTCEAYKRDRSIKPTFKPTGAIVYDERILSFKKLDHVSIATLQGRQIVGMIFGEYQAAKMHRIKGQVDLVLRGNIFFLYATLDVPTVELMDTKKVLGIDLGIVNLAVDSEGQTFSGDRVKQIRGKTLKIAANLQKKGTKSAKRHLRIRSGKFQRFMKNENHCISKELVTKAKDTRSGIALEDLVHIRERATVSKAQRGPLNSWAFAQLRSFISYKAELVGVPVHIVDPGNTSRECPRCHHIGKENRPTRDRFCCVQCGFAGPADHIAAVNIAARANVNTPIVAKRGHSGSTSVTSPFPLGMGN